MSPIRLKIKEYRDKRGMTQLQLAEKANVRRATVSEYETGTVNRIDLGTLDRLARALGVNAALLIEHKKR